MDLRCRLGRSLHLRLLEEVDREGNPLATAMLPPRGEDDLSFGPIIVGVGNSDPYPEHGAAIEALGQHLGLQLSRERCYPYRR